jgi:hypothetical protein
MMLYQDQASYLQTIEIPLEDLCKDHPAIQMADQAKTNIIDYIIGYYSQARPHQHNNGFAENVAEKNYWAEYKTVAKIT